MAKAYPQFRPSYSHEEMVEHFLGAGRTATCTRVPRRSTSLRMALLLKTLSHLGYVPDAMPRIPGEVRSFVAGQLGLLWDPSEASVEHLDSHFLCYS